MKRDSLKLKLVIFLSLAILTSCIALGFIIFYQVKRVMQKQFEEHVLMLAESLSYNSRYGAFTEDSVILDELIEGFIQLEEVVYVAISDYNGNILAKRSKSGASLLDEKGINPSVLWKEAIAAGTRTLEPIISRNRKGLYDVSFPVAPSTYKPRHFPLELLEEKGYERPRGDDSRLLGVVRLGASSHLLDQQIHRKWIFTIYLTLLITVAGVGLTYYLSRRHLKPLETLASVARKVADGDLSQTTPQISRDEIGELTGIFNQMTRSLSQRERECKEYIHQLEDLNQTLESRVKKRTTELEELVCLIHGEKKKTERILHEIDNGVIVTDIYGKTVLINPAAQKMFAGITKGPLSQDLSTLPNLLPNLSRTFNDLTESVTEEIEILDSRLDMSRIFRFTSFPFRDEKGLILGKITVFHDVTHFKEVDRLKSEFVSQVSHELRTPLTSIKGYIDNLRDGITGELNEKQTEYLTRMEKNAERLIRLISDLLDISRIESGKMNLHVVPFQFYELIGGVVNSLRPLFTQKRLEMLLNPFEGDGCLHGDRDRLEQALTNLIDNAIRYTPNGGRITISLEQNHQFLKTTIKDTGVGISPEDQSRIFDRFYTLDQCTLSGPKGTGLGLFITKNIIEMHGGEIRVSSEVGKGSEFSFTLHV